jgi:hypothetical protein
MNLESEFVGWATDEDYQYAKSVYSQHANLGNLAD